MKLSAGPVECARGRKRKKDSRGRGECTPPLREHTVHAHPHTQCTQAFVMDPLTPLSGVDSSPAASSTSAPPPPVSTASAAVPPSSGQSHIGRAVHVRAYLKVSLLNAPVFCALLCVGAPLVSSRPTPRVDSVGKPACELCGRRLADVKHHRAHAPGRACNKHFTPSALASVAAAAATPSIVPLTGTPARPPRSDRKRRRAESDPGEQTILTGTRLRARTYVVKKKPPPVQTTRKKPTSLLSSSLSSSLDETHARRLAFLASAAASSSSSSHQNMK
jgi:hypothetical protein